MKSSIASGSRRLAWSLMAINQTSWLVYFFMFNGSEHNLNATLPAKKDLTNLLGNIYR